VLMDFLARRNQRAFLENSGLRFRDSTWCHFNPNRQSMAYYGNAPKGMRPSENLTWSKAGRR
jgi:hypothetical protein